MKKKELDKILEQLVVWDKNEKCYFPRLVPQEQNYNLEDYFSLLSEKMPNIKFFKKFERIQYAKKRKIYKTYNNFCKIIDEYITDRLNDENNQNTNDIIVKLLYELFDKVNKAIIIFIEVGNNKDAYMLFESLNNRGIPLSAIDLIKNLLMKVSDESENGKKSNECFKDWEEILDYLGSDYNVQERFLRQYYNTYREKLNQDHLVDGKQKYYFGYLATRSTLVDIYEKLINYDYEKFLKNIKLEAKTYSMIINNISPEDSEIPELSDPLLNLERIQGTSSYTLLMYLISNRNNLRISTNQLVKFVNYLIKFFLRRNVTDYPSAKKVDKTFLELIPKISNLEGEKILDEIFKILKEISSEDEIFKEKISGPIYSINSDSVRFLLCYYEEKYRTNEIYTDLWKRDNSNKYIWTIEHIFPEGKNIPELWVKMIANGDKKLAEEYRNEYTHKFGNLTITGYNQSLGNKSFEEKKIRKDKNGNYIGYNNGLKLNENIKNKDKWTIEEIQKRTDELVEIFYEEFKLIC